MIQPSINVTGGRGSPEIRFLEIPKGRRGTRIDGKGPKMVELRRFQAEFIRAACRPDVDLAALSLPRGNGKSWLAAVVAARVLDPTDDLFRPGSESVVIAPSLNQGRIVYRFVRDRIGDDPDYRFADSFTLCQITHKPTRTVLQVRSSSAKGALGLVNCPWVICDEPGAFETTGGEAMFDAISTATGKPGSPLKALFIGTLAPAQGGWWHDLVQRRLGGLNIRQGPTGRPRDVGPVGDDPQGQSV